MPSDIVYYYDLDGVIFDYSEGARRLGFEIDPAKSKEINRSGTNDPFKRQIYEKIKGTTFFQYLPLMPGAKTLWNVNKAHQRGILTASPKFGASEEDYYLNPYWCGAAYHKRRATEFHLYSNKSMPDTDFVCTTSVRKPEYIYHKPGVKQVLIDDRIDNCHGWAAVGGIAILYDGNVEQALECFRLIEKLDLRGAVLSADNIKLAGAAALACPA